MANKYHAQFMENDKGERGLYHGDDVEAALQNGFKKVEGLRANGEPWNPEPEDGEEYSLDQLADAQRAVNKAAAEKAEKKAKKKAEARKGDEKAQAEAQKAHDQKPDLKVQVVEATKK
jgi:hypothetical protein